MAGLDTALMQEVLDVAQRQRVADVERHRQADDFWAGLEIAEGARFGHPGRLGGQIASLKKVPVTAPPEVLNLSDRVLVARQGRIVEEFTPTEATEQRIMYAAVH